MSMSFIGTSGNGSTIGTGGGNMSNVGSRSDKSKDRSEGQRFQSIRRAELTTAKKKPKYPKKPITPSRKKSADIAQNTTVTTADPIPPILSFATISGLGASKLIKIPESNVLQITEKPIENSALEQLYFDSIGTTEIINIARHDDINTINNPYAVIPDIAEINRSYSPNNLVSMQKTASQYFSQFALKLENYQPLYGSGPGNSIVYIDGATGNLVIDTVGIPEGYHVEVQTMTFDDLINDTIYT